MKVLVYGGGSREHALCDKISNSPTCDDLLVYPGNAVTKNLFKSLSIAELEDNELIEACLSQRIDLVVFGPEAPLAAGLSDRLRAKGLRVFGPNQIPAQLESSKSYSKEIMAKAHIPTARYQIARGKDQVKALAEEFLKDNKTAVLKASGLAAGKGVFLCKNEDELEEALFHFFETSMKQATEEVVVEECLEGRECSYFSLVFDNKVVNLGFAVDFKRLNDQDKGPNTGGMGSYSPVSWLPNNASQIVNDSIVEPLMETLGSMNISYTGFLYTGIMWTVNGPKVVEFNVRLGDPEAQILCMLDQRDWLPFMADGNLTGFEEPLSADRAAVGVVLASDGYPFEAPHYPSGQIPFSYLKSKDLNIFSASVKESEKEGCFLTSKGRVMTVVAVADDVSTARERAYEHVRKLKELWPGAQFRNDIALKASKEKT